MKRTILAIDQGTTSSRAILFDDQMTVIDSAQQEFAQHYPHSGWVEHDPEEIWTSVLETVRAVLQKTGVSADDVAALGIANQRETVVIWDRHSGKPIHNAIVWQDRRTAQACETLKAGGFEPLVTDKTGLILDPYFSGTKIAWLLDNVDGAREAAERGDLLAGTIDTFLIWRLTGGRAHGTDATNASRTLLFNIVENRWDDTLLDLLRVPRSLLPEVLNCADDFGETQADLFGCSIPIRGVAGDQQAATIGQACFKPGMVKATYGTGCFAVLNTGPELVRSQNRLLSTIAYRLNGETTYALEGSIFVAGAAVQWLRDGLGLIKTAEESGRLAQEADSEQRVYLVPAFVGLGAPYWDAEARGALFGLTRSTGPRELSMAALESVAFQTADLLDAMHRDWSSADQPTLRVDGGMVVSDWTMQRLADLLAAAVDRPQIQETTALGAAWLAATAVGLWPAQDAFARTWRCERQFIPQMDYAERLSRLEGWRDAVSRTLSQTQR